MNSRYAPQKFIAEDWNRLKDHIKGFFLSLDRNEKSKLLHDNEFREFLIKNTKPGHDLEYILSYFSREDIDNLFDDAFLEMMNNTGNHLMKCVCVQFDVVDIEYLIDKNNGWIDFDNIHNVMRKMHDEYKYIVLDMALNTKLYDYVLCKIFDNFYSVNYNTPYEEDYSPNENQIKWLASKLEDERLRELFLKNKGLNQSLDTKNRCKLYESVSFDDLEKSDKSIILSLLHNAIERSVRLPDNILLDERLYDLIIKQDWGEYKIIYNNLKEIHPEASNNLQSRFNEVQDEYIEEFMNSSFEELENSENWDSVYDWKFRDRVYHRYFNTSACDVYLTACTILDSMNTLPSFKEKFSPEGIELVERMVAHVLMESEANGFREMDMPHLYRGNMDNLKEIVSILQTRNDWREMFEKVMKLARSEFSKNLVSEIYMPNVSQSKLIDNIPVIDITEMKDFRLLARSQGVYYIDKAIPRLDAGLKKDISMSLFDNNHLNAFGDIDGKLDRNEVIFGYSNVESDSILHALPKDSFTDYCDHSNKVRKEALIESTCKYLPTYIDIDSFLNATDRMNEIKVRAKINGTNNWGERAFMPSYILCRDDIRDIDRRVAEEYHIPIVYIDTKRVERTDTSGYRPNIMKLLNKYTEVQLEDTSIIK